MSAAGATVTIARASSSARVMGRVSLERDERWNLLLVCVAAFLTCTVARVHQLWPAIGAAHPAMLSAGAALVLILLDHSTTRGFRAAWSVGGLRWMVWLVIWAVLSIPLALYPGGAFEVVADGLLKSVAMLLAMSIAIRGAKDVHRLMMVFYFGSVLFACYVLAHFEVDDTGRLGKLVYYDANEFALLAAMCMPLGAHGLWRSKNIVFRVLILAGMAALFTVFVSCGSRGAVIALAVGLLATVVTLRAVKLRWRVTAIVVVAIAFVASASDQFWDRMDDAVGTKDDYNITSPTGRVQVWKRGIGYMLDRPILGVGAGNFATAEGKLSTYAAGLRERSSGYKWSVAHNSYVQAGAELGVPGLLFYCAALFGTILSLRRVTLPKRGVKPDADIVGLAYACFIALIIFATGSVFLSLAYSDMLFALLAISIGVQVVARQRSRGSLQSVP